MLLFIGLWLASFSAVRVIWPTVAWHTFDSIWHIYFLHFYVDGNLLTTKVENPALNGACECSLNLRAKY